MANFAWTGLGEFYVNADGQYDFQGLFLVPSAVAFAAALFLFLFFRPPAKTGEAAPRDRLAERRPRLRRRPRRAPW